MKIIGFSQINGHVSVVLKSDSSLLVNRKPFFIPDWSEDVRITPCVVLRVSRLGKNVASKFAFRYYDAIAPGVNVCAADCVAKGDMVRGWAFDYSLVVGQFVELNVWIPPATLISLDEAIERVSQIMTIRQGDMIFVDVACEPRLLIQEEVFSLMHEDNELLHCKIK